MAMGHFPSVTWPHFLDLSKGGKGSGAKLPQWQMGSCCHVFLDKFGYTFPTKASISQWTCIYIHEQFCAKSNHFINLPHLHFNPLMPHSSCTGNLMCMVLYARIASLFALGPSLLHKPSFHMINISSLRYLKSPNKHSMYSSSCTHKKTNLVSLYFKACKIFTSY
jgi:hypothetical protein